MSAFAVLVRNLKYGVTILVFVLSAASVQAEERITFASGNKWIHLAFQSNAIDTEIRNTVLATAVDNGMVVVNFNATVGDYGASRLALEKSQQSIEIKH